MTMTAKDIPLTKTDPLPWRDLSFWQLVRRDIELILAFEDRPFDLKNIVWLIVGPDAFMVLFIFRVRKWLQSYRVPIIGRLLRALQTMLYSIELGVDIELGPGVYFVHSLGTVIGSGAIVHEGCVLYGNNTIGAAHHKDSPVIGPFVKIGAGARVLGEITIGPKVAIGANAVVTKSFAGHQVIGGIPAKVLAPKLRSAPSPDDLSQ